MGPDCTIIIHDWENTESGAPLARFLTENPMTSDFKLLAVVSSSEISSAREILSPLGFEIMEAADSAGPAERKNIGIEAASGEVALVSASIRPPDMEWLERIRGEAKSSGAGVAGCKVAEEGGLVVNAGYHLLQPGCEQFTISGGKKDINQYYYTREVEGVDGTCMYLTAAASALDHSATLPDRELSLTAEIFRTFLP